MIQTLPVRRLHQALASKCCVLYLEAFVDQTLLVQCAEHPPHTLHEAWVQRLVAILKVNPATNAVHCLLPLFGVPECHVRKLYHMQHCTAAGSCRTCSGSATLGRMVHEACLQAVPHDNAAALLIVFANAHFENIFSRVDVCRQIITLENHPENQI